MLALKKALAGTGAVGTLVFDEVDSGIGGATAEVIGEKLSEVANSNQVICITHLPQIACFGETHFFVAKQAGSGTVNTTVQVLTESERVEEITRMMAGVEITRRARDHAREMLKSVKAQRKGIRG